MALQRNKTNRLNQPMVGGSSTVTGDMNEPKQVNPKNQQGGLKRTRKTADPFTGPQYVEVGHTGAGESKYDTNLRMGDLARLGELRASRQPWHEQLGNMFGQIIIGELVGGSIEGAGYMANVSDAVDILAGKEDEFTNAISEFGQSLREWGQEKMPIYQEAPGEFNMSDSGWWFGNGVSVGSTLGLMIPSMGAAKVLGAAGKGISKGLGMLKKGADVAAKMSSKQKWITGGISQAVMSRQAENMMEAHGTFKEKYDDYMEKGMDEKEARALASEAAAFNYKAGWAMIAQDMAQYLLIGKIFNPITGKVESAMKSIGKGAEQSLFKKGSGFIAQAAGEGMEEAYQFMIAEEAKYHTDVKAGFADESTFGSRMTDYLTSGEMWTAALFGAMGGGVFQAVGPMAGDLLKSQKTREGEKNHLKVRQDMVRNRAMSLARRADVVAEADKSGDPEKMRDSRMALNLGATIDAIEMDTYEQHMETLADLRDANDAEIEAYSTPDNPLSKELIDQFVPDMIKQSEEMHNGYLKFRNKHSKSVASSLAMNQFQLKQFAKVKSDAVKEIKSLVASTQELTQARPEAIGVVSAENKLEALKQVKTWLNNRRKDSNNDGAKLDKQLKSLDKKITKASKELEASRKNYKGLGLNTAEDKVARDLAGAFRDDFVGQEATAALADLTIEGLAADMKEIASPAFKEKARRNELKRKYAQLTNADDIARGIESLEKQNDFGTDEESMKDYEATKTALKERLAAVRKAEAEGIKKDTERTIEEEKDQQVPPSGVDTKAPDTDDGFEDFHDDSGQNGTEGIIPAQDQNVLIKLNNGNNIRVLDTGRNAQKFRDFLVNGRDKTGMKAEYKVGEPIESDNKKLGAKEVKALRQHAVEVFEKAKETGDITLMDNKAYLWLPIKVEFDNDPTLFNYIHDANIMDKEASSGLAEGQKSFLESEHLERKVIINNLIVNGSAETTVNRQYGGALVTDHQYEEGTNEILEYAEHQLTDLQIDNNTLETLEVFFSGKTGRLFDEDKLPNPEMPFQMFRKDLANGGGSIPYAGGVYLKVPRANGTPFPMKLNMGYMSEQQADMIAEIVIDLFVRNKGQNEDTRLDILKETRPELYAQIEKTASAEMKVIGPEATVRDLINMFSFFSSETKGFKSEFMRDGEYIRFGGKMVVTPESINEQKPKLVEFLTTIKRRQFKRSFWAKTNPQWKKYRKYMVENKVVSTDAVIGEPIFQKEVGAPVSMYLNPMNMSEPVTVSEEGDTSVTKEPSSQEKAVTLQTQENNVVEKATKQEEEIPMTEKEVKQTEVQETEEAPKEAADEYDGELDDLLLDQCD